MIDTEDLLKIACVTFIGLGATALVAAADITGTSSINPFTGNDGEPRYVLSAEVGVESAELSTDKIRINEDSFRSNVEKQGLMPSLSMAGPGSELSVFAAEDVTLEYTLNGPVNSPVTDSDDLGSIGSISDSKKSSFKAGNLPCGHYVLHMNLYWNTGEDYHREDIQIQCTGDNE